MKDKSHLNQQGFKQILKIKSNINLGLSKELLERFPNLVLTSSAKSCRREDLVVKNPYWLAGFTSGNGCFFVSIRKSPFTVTGYAVEIKLRIAQHSRDIKLIKSLVSYLECGRVEEDLKYPMVYFVVNRLEDILIKVIPFFDLYPILGVKGLDYPCFKHVANLMKDKAHLTEKGLEKIRGIKPEMNKLRVID